MKYITLISVTISLVSGFQPLSAMASISKEYWSSETFQKRFMGSYGINSEIEPTITAAEQDLFQELIPMVQQDLVAQSVKFLLKYMKDAESYSAALDFTLANLYFQENVFELAKENYEVAIRKFPSFRRCYENLGRIAVMEGEYEAAKANLINALELGSISSDIYGLLGFCYLNEGKPASALTAYNIATLHDPDSKDWKLGKAQALIQSGRDLDGIALLKELLNEDLSNRSLVLSISNSYLNLGEYLNSALFLELLERSGNSDGSSLLLLGDIYMNEELFNLASAAYEKAMTTNYRPLGLSDSLRIAKVYSERELVDEASKVIKLIDEQFASKMSDEKNLELLIIKSKVAFLEGDLKKASQSLHKIIDTDPCNGEALLTLANLYWENGDLESAGYYFSRAQKIDASMYQAHVDNARMLVQASELGKAEKLLRRAYNLSPSQHLKEYLDAVSSAIAN